jgi:predicted DNA-binding transcriptional regulator AlpA
MGTVKLTRDTRVIVGTAEIAEMLSLTRQRVGEMAREGDLPKPLGVVQAGAIWRRTDIERWMDKRKTPDG